MVLQRSVVLGNNIHIMTQPPEKGEEPCLPHSLSGVNTYTKMATGSRHVAIVIKNQTTVPVIIRKGLKVTHVVAAYRVPPIEVMPGTLERFPELRCLLCVGRRCLSSS